MRNMKIRQAAQAANIRFWQIADELGISCSWLSIKMRHELPEDEQGKILSIIEKLAAQG